jgi:hypothetical protein
VVGPPCAGGLGPECDSVEVAEPLRGKRLAHGDLVAGGATLRGISIRVVEWANSCERGLL